MTEITVLGFSIKVDPPYSPEQPLGTTEAALLNKLWCDKLKAKVRPLIENFTPPNEDGTKPKPDFSSLSDGAKDKVTEAAQLMLRNFKLVPPNQRITDPVLKHAHSLARDIIESQLKLERITTTTETKKALIQQYLDEHPELIEAGERFVQKQNDMAGVAQSLIARLKSQ